MEMSLAEKVQAVVRETGKGIPTNLGSVFEVYCIYHGHTNSPDDVQGASHYFKYSKAGCGIPDERPLNDVNAAFLNDKADEILGLAPAEPA